MHQSAQLNPAQVKLGLTSLEHLSRCVQYVGSIYNLQQALRISEGTSGSSGFPNFLHIGYAKKSMYPSLISGCHKETQVSP